MLVRLKAILKTEVVKVSTFTALSTGIKMLTGLVTIKIFATIIGPSGIALLGQLGNFSSIIQAIASGGINTGVTKYIAEYRNSNNKLSAIISASTWISLIFSILAGIFLVLFSRFLSIHILKSDDYNIVFLIFGGTLILYTFNNLLLSILNGLKEYKKYIIINIITSITGLIFSIFLVLIWNIKGALISYITYQSVIFFITFAIIRKSSWNNYIHFFRQFDIKAGSQLIKFSLMTLVSALIIPSAQLFIRNFLLANQSIMNAGIWEGMNKISNMYLMIITTSLSVYYLPKLSETKDNRELKYLILKVFKLIMPLMLIGTISIYIGRDTIIRVLYTADFISMRDLFFYQLIGDFFKVATWIVAYQMWAKGMTIVFISTEIIFNLTLIIASVICINHFHLQGASIAYMLNYIGCFITMVIIFRKQLCYGL